VAKFGQGLLSIAQGNFSEGIDQIKQSFNGLGDEMEREIAIAVSLKKEMQDFEKAQIVSSVAIAKLRSEIDRLNATYGDTSVSMKEQLAAQQEILKLRAKISEAMVKEAREALRHKVTQDGTNEAVKEFYDRMTDSNVLMMSFTEQAKLAEELTSKIGISESGNEDLKEVADLIKAIIAAEDERVQGARRTNSAINGLIAQEAAARKKAADDEAAAAKLAEEQRIKDQEALADAAFKMAETVAAKRAELDDFLRHRTALNARQEMEAAIKAEQDKLTLAEMTAVQLGMTEEEIQRLKQASVDEQLRIEQEYRDKLAAMEQEGVDAVKKAEDEKAAKRAENAENSKAYTVQLMTEALSSISNIYGSINQMAQQSADWELAMWRDKLDEGLITREEFDAKERKLQADSAQRAKDAATFNAVIGAAQAAINALASPGVPFPVALAFALMAAATAAVQVAAIQSAQVPQFATGVIGLQGAGTETSDSIHARLSKGESVMTAKETRQYRPILEAIRKGSLERLIAETYVRPAVDSAMLSGFADMGRSADLNGLTAKLSDHNIIAAMDRNRSATVYGLKMLADEIKANKRRGDRNTWH
jgi:phage host-nuclease inhibitor protein Gam